MLNHENIYIYIFYSAVADSTQSMHFFKLLIRVNDRDRKTSCSYFVLLNNNPAADCDIHSLRVKGFNINFKKIIENKKGIV